jgi:outer membrane lipoprotein-sorting protein
MALTLLAVLAARVDAGETARQILDRRKALDDTTRHWDDRYQRMTLRLFDRLGGERVRELEVYEARYPDDEEKTILFFRSPADVRGTAFLAYTHKGRPADQWLFLPALKRTRPITTRMRKESFVGTDLSYHDLDLIQEMTSWSETDARSRLRAEETIDGTPTHVIELAPQREDIGYRRIVLWLGREDLVPRRLEFYEEDEAPKRRIAQSDIRASGAIPVAHRVEVATPSAGSHTVIEVTGVRFNQGLKEDLFTQRHLELGGP